MIDLTPLESLYDVTTGLAVDLPADLARLYGELRVPTGHGDRPGVIANFVSTLDGVVSLKLPGHSGGSEISGFNRHDRMVMGILRAVSDAVVVGAGTLRAVPRHRWTPGYVFPALEESYRQLRRATGRSGEPLNVIVTAGGELDLTLPVFQSEAIATLIVTTDRGSARLLEGPIPPTVTVRSVSDSRSVSPGDVLRTIAAARPGNLVLVEGGPRLLGDFLAESCLDELFLTLAPQIAGRAGEGRPGLVDGRTFAPGHPLWGRLVSLKRANDHLFLRYAMPV
ncbi:MAG: RibD family protein [Chloroflexota bacterium]